MEITDARIKLAIVEDTFLTRISLRHEFMQDNDILILGEYDNAEDCILSLNIEKPDVILMDLGLKSMNGLEACAYIKQKYPQIKIIIYTAHESKDILAASLFTGADAFLIKNRQNKKLTDIVKVVNQGAFWLDSNIISILRNIFPKPASFDLSNLYGSGISSFHLTERELEVLRLVVQGKSNSEIAKEIIVSTNTAKAHVGSILNKMQVKDRVQAAVKAIKSNIV